VFPILPSQLLTLLTPTLQFIDELKSGDNQESLELIKVPLDEKNVEFLLTEAATIPALRSIVLQRCSLQLASIEKICGWANQNKHITTLDLARNVLSEDSFGCLGKYLANPDCALVKVYLICLSLLNNLPHSYPYQLLNPPRRASQLLRKD